jgi:hypothetical protein
MSCIIKYNFYLNCGFEVPDEIHEKSNRTDSLFRSEAGGFVLELYCIIIEQYCAVWSNSCVLSR